MLWCLIQPFENSRYCKGKSETLSQDMTDISLKLLQSLKFLYLYSFSRSVWDCRGSLPFGSSPSELLAFCTEWIQVSVQFLFTFSICLYLPSNLLAKPYFCFPDDLSLTPSLIQSKWFLSKYSFYYLTLLTLRTACSYRIQLKHQVCLCSYTAWQVFSLEKDHKCNTG